MTARTEKLEQRAAGIRARIDRAEELGLPANFARASLAEVEEALALGVIDADGRTEKQLNAAGFKLFAMPRLIGAPTAYHLRNDDAFVGAVRGTRGKGGAYEAYPYSGHYVTKRPIGLYETRVRAAWALVDHKGRR